jgi:hypothetical protein
MLRRILTYGEEEVADMRHDLMTDKVALSSRGTKPWFSSTNPLSSPLILLT